MKPLKVRDKGNIASTELPSQREQNRARLAKKLQAESHLVAKNSMSVLAEMEQLENPF